ncbi:L,D-transpeptidase family protein [Sphingosinicella sp. LHD-64]|uniref:L,D-transpeptidase family protein n=1 Tax=Sphingosinicella sp. LHD-64 TaxID=3072139 RepID=UPI00280E0591|nr:L,D-transpeptidase family protein [Sphingosinicella sp. LHD-64]MDQ8756765.1 L,D-transpeptidase family protein [Sphingosinicella sp. LHD-64]
MRRGSWIAALLVLSGCASQNNGDGGNGVAAVQPSQIAPGALRAAVRDRQVRRFYEARDWQPAWTVTAAEALVAAIGEAPRHGLDPRLFLAEARRAETPAAREAALSLAALGYAEALARGRADPTRLQEVYALPRPDTDIVAGLNHVLPNGVRAWLAGLAPRDEEYRRLSEAYVAADRQARTARRRTPIPDGLEIRAGRADRRLPDIAAALAADGYYQPPEGQPTVTRLTPELAAAVKRVQEDYGLAADGVIAGDTLAAINEGAFERARTLAINLERRRWLSREAPATRIDVNTASAMLTYWRDGRAADRRRVVVGEPGNETPELGSPLYRLVANPTWTVPRSIQAEEIAPKGAGYLRRNNMEWRDGWIVQRSGPTNSLGLVKFDMRNDHAIYLHDTPAKPLFAEDDRHASHGCVRVEDALGFAQMIADQEGVRTEWDRARAGGDEAFVPLPRPIPVRLMYQTAFVEGDRVRYRLDYYGWDDAVARALGLASRPPRPARERSRDIGP